MLKKAIGYARSHLSVALVSAMAVCLMASAVIMESYLKRQYYDFLLAETAKTERAMLSTTSYSLNSLFYDAVYVSAEIASDRDLATLMRSAAADESVFARNHTRIVESLSSASHVAPNIAAITFVKGDQVVFEYGQYWYAGGYSNLWTGDNLAVLPVLRDKLEAQMGTGLIPRYSVATEPQLLAQFPELKMYHIAMPMIRHDGRFDTEMMLVISCRMDRAIQSGILSSGAEDVVGYLTDDEDRIFLHPKPEWQGKQIAEEEDSLHLTQELKFFGWKLHADIDAVSMRQRVDAMYQKGFTMYVALMALTVVLWVWRIRRVLRPIGRIQEAMTEIRRGNLERQIPIEGEHELWQLAEHYNAMVVDLAAQRQETKRHYHERMDYIRAKNRAERKALESQIDAHFICNTLAALHYDALEAGNVELSQLLKQLSEMLHYAFSTRTEFVTIGQELKWAQEYLSLQKFRLADVFDYEIVFPEEYAEWPCCKLVFQPFIENSILHGFEGWESGGKIRIEGRAEGDRLRVEIRDNGRGMTSEAAERVQLALDANPALASRENGHGVGIRNVAARLKMFYGERLTMEFTTREGDGCSFVFWLPIPPSKEEKA